MNINSAPNGQRRVIDGRYQLSNLLGDGGSAAVWRAKDLERGIDVALKLMHPRFGGPAALQRLHREIRVLENLAHDNIGRALGHQLDHDPPFIVLELIDGTSLDLELGVRAGVARHWSPPEFSRIFGCVADAVQYAHSQGVVHRDLKPHNIMLETKSGTIKVIDFGLAYLLDENGRSFETTHGRVLGSRYYMSPEQSLGERADQRSDVFSLAVVAFEMLTLHRAWLKNADGSALLAFVDPALANEHNSPHRVLKRIVSGPRLSVSDIVDSYSRDIDDVLQRAMHIRPDMRYASVAEFSEALQTGLLVESDTLVDEVPWLGSNVVCNLPPTPTRPPAAPIAQRPQPSLEPGELFGEYVLLRRIGEGASAQVFKAQRQQGREHVAIKILRDSKSGPSPLRWHREATILSLLRHPNICTFLEAGSAKNATYLAMEFIEGRSLATLQRQLKDLKQAMPLGMSLSILCAALAGLDYAHRCRAADGTLMKLVHRDVKPANLMVTDSGEVKLIDFGIAYGQLDDFRTRPGMVLGTCRYMSPEQVLAKPLDARSDVYSLGVIAYELLSGQRVVKKAGMEDMMRAVAQDPPNHLLEVAPAVPPMVANAVMAALAKDPESRIATARDFRDALISAVTPSKIYDAKQVKGAMQALLSDAIGPIEPPNSVIPRPPAALETTSVLTPSNVLAASLVGAAIGLAAFVWPVADDRQTDTQVSRPSRVSVTSNPVPEARSDAVAQPVRKHRRQADRRPRKRTTPRPAPASEVNTAAAPKGVSEARSLVALLQIARKLSLSLPAPHRTLAAEILVDLNRASAEAQRGVKLDLEPYRARLRALEDLAAYDEP